jgi:TPR repeat protein
VKLIKQHDFALMTTAIKLARMLDAALPAKEAEAACDSIPTCSAECSAKIGSGCLKAAAMYAERKSEDGDEERSLIYYKQACKMKLGRACGSLGSAYAEKDQNKAALQMYMLGCNLKDGESCKEVADAYDGGDGVGQSDKLATLFHRKACDSGFKESCGK